MHICFISVEIFAWGKYGGFGRATRTIGKELVKRGIKVSAIIPRREGQKPYENLDGISVYGFPPNNPFAIKRIIKQINANIYHSQEPSFSTFLAQWFMPHKAHIVTCRDTRNDLDWKIESSLPTRNRLQVLKNRLYEDNFLVAKAVQDATRVFAASGVVQEKAYERYHLLYHPAFLPTPIDVSSEKEIKKAKKPTVCFVARWDRRKRPELFFNLAKKFPHIHFIAAGKSHDTKWDIALRKGYAKIPNLEMTGMLNQFDNETLTNIYQKSWILINTAAREGLPNSFIEALAHKTAILSSVNPDQFASRFGYFAQNDNFEQGLKWLLENDRWRTQGEAGYKHISNVFATEVAIERHLKIYEELMGK